MENKITTHFLVGVKYTGQDENGEEKHKKAKLLVEAVNVSESETIAIETISDSWGGKNISIPSSREESFDAIINGEDESDCKYWWKARIEELYWTESKKPKLKTRISKILVEAQGINSAIDLIKDFCKEKGYDDEAEITSLSRTKIDEWINYPQEDEVNGEE